MVTKVDFFIIGAQKAGTTSLYRYVGAHPRVFMPAQKETAFFYHDHLYDRGLEWYLRTFFPNAPSSPEVKVGEASPQYMRDERVPGRIHEHFPDARLIAVLRNPIDRAYSAYRMQVRRGLESREFGAVIDELIAGSEVTGQTAPIADPVDSYLAVGCYATILGWYLRLFERERIRIVVSERLQAEPLETVRGLFRFLELDDSYVPDNIDRHYHVGGRVRFGLIDRLVRSPNPLRKLLKPLLPLRVRNAVKYWAEQWNVAPEPDPGPEAADRRKLAAWYADEVARAESLFEVRFGWEDFQPARAPGPD